MKILDVLYSKGRTGFYFDDQNAIKAGAKHDGFFYDGKAITDGFNEVRQAGESISIQLILENGHVAHGDCAAVQYSGAGGRDPLFTADYYIPFLEKHITPKLKGKEVDTFSTLAEEFDSLEVENKRLHTAIRYGISQALLDASSKANNCTMAEIISKEYMNNAEIKQIPIFTQSGDARYENFDKMIIKSADVLPHALINNVEEKLGEDGELLIEYISWMRERILSKRTEESYNPIMHVDVYGTMGITYNNDLDKVYDLLERCSKAASPFLIRIEGPCDTGDKEGTIKALKYLTEKVNKNKLNLEIVADEWCNTYDDIVDFADENAGHMLQIKTPDLGGVNNIAKAIVYCNKLNIGSYSGGTCNETNRSAEVTTNIAMACHAKQCLAKPGMGVDEGYMIVFNEQQRVLQRVKYNKNR